MKWLTRRAELRYAADGGGGVVLNELDGLTGETAGFAWEMLEGERLESSAAGKFIKRVVLPSVEGLDMGPEARSGGPGWGRNPRGGGRTGEKERAREVLEREVLERELEGVEYVVQCIGFGRGALPEVRPGLGALEGPLGKPKRILFNGVNGSFFPNGGRREQVIGLFGAGSAFPELVFTTQGWRQPAVSVLRFMGFLKRMVPGWVEATKKGWFSGRDGKQRGRLGREARAARDARVAASEGRKVEEKSWMHDFY